MSRRFTALKPQLNRIRAWAHEGSTDAWIAHQLDTTAEAVRAFRQEHGIERGGPAPLAPITPDSVVEAMLAEEEAAAAAGELAPDASATEAEAQPEDEPAPAPRARKPRQRAAKPAAEAPEADPAESAPAEDAPARSSTSRRRGARGGAGRGAAAAAATAEVVEEQPAAEAEEAEAASDGEPARTGTARKRGGRRRGRGRGAGRGLEARLLPGSVLLLDPGVTTDPLFQEHWAEAGQLRVEISADAIVLRRSAADAEPSSS